MSARELEGGPIPVYRERYSHAQEDSLPYASRRKDAPQLLPKNRHPNSYTDLADSLAGGDDFLPPLDFPAAPDSVKSEGCVYNTPKHIEADEPLVEMMHAAGEPPTPDTLAALGDAQRAQINRWLEGVRYNNFGPAVEGVNAWSVAEQDAALAGAADLAFVGDWAATSEMMPPYSTSLVLDQHMEGE